MDDGLWVRELLDAQIQSLRFRQALVLSEIDVFEARPAGDRHGQARPLGLAATAQSAQQVQAGQLRQ